VIRVFVVSRSSAARTRLAALCRTAGLEVVGEGLAPPDSPSGALDAIVALDEDADGPDPFDDAAPALVLVSDRAAARDRAAQSSARGWAVVPLHAEAEDLAAAAWAAVRGFMVSPAVDPESRGAAPVTRDTLESVEPMTPREREILELLAQGLSNRAIAAALGISGHTVKFHLASIYGKLGASTRTGAVRRALHRGLIAI
jgi:DNA-binding NarL/FixJ family response regulator